MLINNIEEYDPYGSKIHKASDEVVIDNLTINTFPMTFLTRFMGAEMKKREGAHKSAIITMASYYSQYPSPNAPVFGASKAYQDVVSQTVGMENSDMDILTVKHMPSKSKMHPRGVNPQDTVEGVFMDLGQERISYGHWTHSLFRYWILAKQS
jgi:short-subunit dehydrogenase